MPSPSQSTAGNRSNTRAIPASSPYRSSNNAPETIVSPSTETESLGCCPQGSHEESADSRPIQGFLVCRCTSCRKEINGGIAPYRCADHEVIASQRDTASKELIVLQIRRSDHGDIPIAVGIAFVDAHHAAIGTQLVVERSTTATLSPSKSKAPPYS